MDLDVVLSDYNIQETSALRVEAVGEVQAEWVVLLDGEEVDDAEQENLPCVERQLGFNEAEEEYLPSVEAKLERKLEQGVQATAGSCELVGAAVEGVPRQEVSFSFKRVLRHWT